MREHKYRVWLNKEQEYRYLLGFVHGQNGNQIRIWFLEDGKIVNFARRPGAFIFEQYMDLKDCKQTEEFPEGQELYEGDIVKWKGYEVINGKQIRPERIWEIIFDYYRLFQIENIIRDNGSLEKIGNIHASKEVSCPDISK